MSKKRVQRFLKGTRAEWTVVDPLREVEEGANAAQEEGKVAILAGMNITDELFTTRQDKDRIENRFEERIQALTELIDETLST